MKRIIIILTVLCTAWQGNIRAQSASDAMLFSRYYAGGTARSTGMSGAFGALGGDLSVLSTNPAGLAVYRGSEFTFTPALNFTGTDAQYADGKFNERSTRFILNNIGYVYTKNFYNEKGLQTLTFGIAYNRLSDFNSNAYVKRSKASSSLLDEFLFYANGYDRGGRPRTDAELQSGQSAFYEGLAWETYAIDYDQDHNEYYTDYTDRGYDQPLHRTMSTRGGVGEYDLSIGLNLNHNLFLGATLGIQDIYYQEYYFHKEDPGFEFMQEFDFSEEYTINGWGLNFKAGLIYRPVQALRLGAAIHTPTQLWLKPYHLTGMETVWDTSPADDGAKYFIKETESDPYEKCTIRTPWRYNLSAATVIGNIATVDVDVEIADYSKCKIAPKADYNVENDDISAIFKTAVSLKAGAEFRLGPVYLRGGVACYGDPYNRDAFDEPVKSTLKKTVSYSGGIGFRARDFYMDAAYSYMKHPARIHNLYMSYDADGEWYETAKLQTGAGKVILTFGFRF